MSASAKLQPYLGIRCSQHGPKFLCRPLSTTSRRLRVIKDIPKLPSDALALHYDTIPPTPAQLSHAGHFFSRQPPSFLWSAEKFKTMDYGSSPEVCFLGRSNVGKSSLLNALLCRKIAHTSSKPGRTKLMNAFAVGGSEDNGQNRLVVLDMPGYGQGGRAEWGEQIMKYLEKRKELKRAFLLIDAEHGIKNADRQMLAIFKQQDIPFQVILSKADKLLYRGSNAPNSPALIAGLQRLKSAMERVKEEVQPDTEDDGGAVGEVIACSSEKWVEGKRMGIDAVRFAMLRAAGLEYRPKIKLAKPVEIISHDELIRKV